MSQTRQRLTKGVYAYCSHSLLLTGEIFDVFVGKWLTKDDTRVLQKFPPEDLENGELMCLLKLRRPISLKDYREVHHPSLRPMVQSQRTDVSMLLMPAAMACTIPDGM